MPRTHFIRLALLGLSLAAALAMPARAPAAPLAAGSTAIISGTPSLSAAFPAPVNNAGISSEAVSADGRYVTFTSTSDGLLSGDDDLVQNVYVKDRANGAVTLVSRRTGAAGEPAHQSCDDPVISDDGSRVAFTCTGPLDAADDNGDRDVYLRELASGTTKLASRVGTTGPAGDGASRQPSLSADGKTLAYTTEAGNLTAGSSPGGDEVLVRAELGGGLLVDVASRRSASNGNGVVTGTDPSISDDGKLIAFDNPPGGQVDPADTNLLYDVYVRNVDTATTVLASRRAGSQGAVGDGHSRRPALAGDGSAVAFESEGHQFDVDADDDAKPDVYRRSLTANSTTLVNVNTAGTKGDTSTAPSIDRSGDVIGFVSRATQLDQADSDPAEDAYVKNLATNRLRLASRADGAEGAVANAVARTVAVSGDGTKVGIALGGGRITPDVDPRRPTVALRDLATDATTSVARPAGGAPFRNEGGAASGGAVSADGRFVAFVSGASALGLPDNVAVGVFVRDRVTGSVTLASRADGPAGAALDAAFATPAISGDGRRGAFRVDAGVHSRIWVRDLGGGRTFLASRADGPNGPDANGGSYDPSLDADGSRVAFLSTATNLGDGDDEPAFDVHVRDLSTGQTILASRANGANGPKGNGASPGGRISADGQRVAFASTATNLGDGDTDTVTDVHLRDLAAGSTRLVSAQPGGTKGNGASHSPSIDASGSRIAFATTATNLAGAASAVQKVLVADLQAGNLTLASRADGSGEAANATAFSPAISPDGGYVAFDSAATNLAPGVPAGIAQVWRRDLARARTDLVSRGTGAGGAALTQQAAGRGISRGGSCVTFGSSEQLFAPATEYPQLYLRALDADCGDARGGGTPAGGAPGGGAPGGGATADRTPGALDTTRPVLSRTRLSRKRIRVRRGKTTLSFSSSERARLSISVDRVQRGRRASRAGSLTRQIVKGPGRVRLTTRMGGRRLRPGRYRLTLVARDGAGNRSKTTRLTLRITSR